MNKKFSKQALRSLIEARKIERDIKLSLSESLKLKKGSKSVRTNKSFEGVSFETFILMAQHMGLDIKFYVTVDRHKTTYIYSVFDMDRYTLKGVMWRIVNLLEEKNDIAIQGIEINLDAIKHYLRLERNVEFESFIEWAELLDFRVDIV